MPPIPSFTLFKYEAPTTFKVNMSLRKPYFLCMGCKVQNATYRTEKMALAAHMGSEYVSREKKSTMVNFLIFVQKNVSTIRFQEIKIRPFQDFEKKAFFSLFLMRKRLSSGQKWFLRPYFPLIRGMFLLKSGLRFSFRALEVPKPRVRKRPY